MFTAIGACPRCGAPRWAPGIWHAVTPPPSYPSCGCYSASTMPCTSTSTTDVAEMFTKILRQQSERAAKNCRLTPMSRGEILDQIANEIETRWAGYPRCSAGIDNGPCINCSESYTDAHMAAKAVRALKA